MGTRSISRRTAVALVAIACGAAVAGGPAHAGVTSGSSSALSAYTSTLRAGESLGPDQWLRSDNGRYTAAMQGDGNFVLYGPSGPTWSTRSSGQNGAHLVMQGDGNLVLYKGSTPVWYTGTAGYNGAWLGMQDDGNLVMYRNGVPLWATSWHSVRGVTRSVNGADWGWCSWYAYERFKGFSGVYPDLSGGNAHTWNDTARNRGWLVIDSPVTQAIVVFERGVQGADAGMGHVAWVDVMRPRADGGTDVHIWEMNARGFGVVSERWVKHVAGMSYVMAPQL